MAGLYIEFDHTDPKWGLEQDGILLRVEQSISGRLVSHDEIPLRMETSLRYRVKFEVPCDLRWPEIAKAILERIKWDVGGDMQDAKVWPYRIWWD